jgi:NADPH-dependent 2,4-dienoyl-CoA reductase/sulfur reductase-like enzyme
VTAPSTAACDHIVVVGAGVAGVSAAEALRHRGYDGRLTLISAEREHPYNRPPLSKELLTGELDEDDIRLIPDDEWAGLGIDFVPGVLAKGLDPDARVLATTVGGVAYDRLIIATGSAAVRPAGWDLMSGVHTLRSLSDAQAIRDEMTHGQPSVVVIGGGFIGCEIASAARKHGLSVTIVEAEPLPLWRALGSVLAKPVARLHEDHGVRLLCETSVRRLVGSGRVEAVEFADGSRLAADLVVIGVGAAPMTGWLAGTPLHAAGGVPTDATLRTEVPEVYAIGDAARWRSPGGSTTLRMEHWTTAREHGALAAANLLDPSAAREYTAIPYVWSDQHGQRLQLAGATGRGQPRFVPDARSDGGYLAVLVEDGVVIGMAGLGRTGDFARLRRLVGTGAPFSAVSDHLGVTVPTRTGEIS